MQQQLIDFVRREISMGASPEEIKKALASSAWPPQDVEEAIKNAAIGQGAPGIQNTAIPNSSTPAAAPVIAQEVILPVGVQQPVQAAVTTQQAFGEVPSSVRVFELLMYVSLLAGILINNFANRLFGGNTLEMSAELLLRQSLSLIIFVFLTWMAARRRKDWARWIIVVFLGLRGIALVTTILSAVLLSRFSSLIILAEPILQIIALCYIFSSSANKWFGTSSETVVLSGIAGKSSVGVQGTVSATSLNRKWTVQILRTNIGFLIVYIGLLFGIDMPMAISSPELLGFWYIMLAVFSVFLIFFALETFVYRKRFSTTTSGTDSGLLVIIVLRNVLFLLNFIPFIQILGLVGLPTVGLVLLILYVVFIVRRSAGVKSLQASA